MKKRISSRKAKCLCGGVQFKINGDLRDVINCHCNQCMKTHGNFASYTNCLEKNITFTKVGSLKWFRSSSFAKRGFCNICGASIFYKKDKSSAISISAGLLENPTKLKTYSNIFTKGKLDYYKLDPKLLRFNKYYK